MSEKIPPRPTQTTLAGSLVVSASAFVVFSLFGSIGQIRSLENRRMWEEALAEPGVGGLGLGIDQVLTGLYVLSLVTAACATATAVLGVFVLRRHRQARVVLSVVTVPLFVAGFLTGGLLVAVVAAAVVWLWLQPSRDWFDGKEQDRPQPTTPAAAPGDPAAGDRAASDPAPQPDGSQDRPASEAPAPWGRPTASAQPSPARAFTGYGEPAGGTDTLTRAVPGTPADAPRSAATRPGAVVAACAATWIVAGLVAVFAAIGIAAVVVDPDEMLRQTIAQDPQLADQGVTAGMLVTATAVLGGVVVVWALAAAVLAAYAFRGANGARIGLLVSAGLAGALSLLPAILLPPLVVVVAAAVVTIVALLRPASRDWYAARGRAAR